MFFWHNVCKLFSGYKDCRWRARGINGYRDNVPLTLNSFIVQGLQQRTEITVDLARAHTKSHTSTRRLQQVHQRLIKPGRRHTAFNTHKVWINLILIQCDFQWNDRRCSRDWGWAHSAVQGKGHQDLEDSPGIKFEGQSDEAEGRPRSAK